MPTRSLSNLPDTIRKQTARMRAFPAFFILLLAGVLPCQAQENSTTSPQDTPYNLTFSTSVATRHFHPDPAHNNTQHLLHLEWNYEGDMVAGAAAFRNSYRQPTQLIYWGKKIHPLESAPDMYVKVVGGFIHGYKDEYRDKIPLNKLGVAPVILPSVGYCYKHVCSELIVFGTAGAMLTAGVRF